MQKMEFQYFCEALDTLSNKFSNPNFQTKTGFKNMLLDCNQLLKDFDENNFEIEVGKRNTTEIMNPKHNLLYLLPMIKANLYLEEKIINDSELNEIQSDFKKFFLLKDSNGDVYYKTSDNLKNEADVLLRKIGSFLDYIDC